MSDNKHKGREELEEAGDESSSSAPAPKKPKVQPTLSPETIDKLREIGRKYGRDATANLAVLLAAILVGHGWEEEADGKETPKHSNNKSQGDDNKGTSKKKMVTGRHAWINDRIGDMVEWENDNDDDQKGEIRKVVNEFKKDVEDRFSNLGVYVSEESLLEPFVYDRAIEGTEEFDHVRSVPSGDKEKQERFESLTVLLGHVTNLECKESINKADFVVNIYVVFEDGKERATSSFMAKSGEEDAVRKMFQSMKPVADVLRGVEIIWKQKFERLRLGFEHVQY